MSRLENYALSFEISVKGTKLKHGSDIDILSVSVTDTADRADSFTFTVRERHTDKERLFAGGKRLKLMDNGLFDEGNKVEIKLGHEGDLAFEFVGEITAVSPSFPESGLSTLAVRGFSNYHRLQRRRRRKAFTRVKDSDIAKEIAKAVELKCKADETDVEYQFVPAEDMDYASILKQRAQRIGYEVVVKKDVLYFEKPRYLVNRSPVLTLEWGKDLRSFHPSLSTYNMVTEVNVRASRTSREEGKDPVVGKARAGSEKVKMGDKTGSEIAEGVFGKNLILSQDHHVTTQKEANELALAQLQASSLDFIVGRGSCIGNPRLKARVVIELARLGKRFSGNYYVTSVTHTIDSAGYRTDFEVKRNAR
jgi:phage protein D